VRNLCTTIATYADLASANSDWAAVEGAASAHSIDLADAALVERRADGETVEVNRQSHHGWGKGAVAGAVVGVLFPPSLVAGAVAGAAGGGVLARMNRSLDRSDIKDLGEVMDSGEIALVVLTHEDSVATLDQLLRGATKKLTRASSTAEEVQQALDADATATAAR
jgi:uncharacterized membrane protein